MQKIFRKQTLRRGRSGCPRTLQYDICPDRSLATPSADRANCAAFQDSGYSLLCYISSLHTSLVCTSFHIYSIVKIKVGHYACWPIPLANTYLPNFAFFPSFPQLSLLLASQSAYRCLLGRKSFLCMFLDQLVQLPPPWSFLLVSSHLPPKYLPWA